LIIDNDQGITIENFKNTVVFAHQSLYALIYQLYLGHFCEIDKYIFTWKTGRKVKKLEHRADKAENHAATATFLAIATIEEAEKATLDSKPKSF
jgi:hypothetical protein